MHYFLRERLDYRFFFIFSNRIFGLLLGVELDLFDPYLLFGPNFVSVALRSVNK
jgi:hypothetical protein